jgi:hypothetical protein
MITTGYTGGLPALIGGLLMVGSWSARRRWRRDSALWHQAVPIAMRLKYCARDHVVFDPANANTWMHPTRSRSYVIDCATTRRGIGALGAGRPPGVLDLPPGGAGAVDA